MGFQCLNLEKLSMIRILILYVCNIYALYIVYYVYFVGKSLTFCIVVFIDSTDNAKFITKLSQLQIWFMKCYQNFMHINCHLKQQWISIYDLDDKILKRKKQKNHQTCMRPRTWITRTQTLIRNYNFTILSQI